MTKKIFKNILFLAMGIFTFYQISAFADEEVDDAVANSHPDLSANTLAGFYVDPFVGVSFAKVKNDEVVYYNHTTYDGFISKNLSTKPVFFGLSTGYGWQLAKLNNTVWQVGAGVYHDNNYQAEGTIAQSNNLNLENKSYSYRLQSSRAMLESKLLFANWLVFPYLSAGVGYTRNDMHSYSEQVLKDTPTLSAFGDKKTNHLAYQLGAGVGYQFTTNVSFNLGYQFVSLGKGEFDAKPDYKTGGHLTTDNIHTNDILLGLMFTFN